MFDWGYWLNPPFLSLLWILRNKGRIVVFFTSGLQNGIPLRLKGNVVLKCPHIWIQPPFLNILLGSAVAGEDILKLVHTCLAIRLLSTGTCLLFWSASHNAPVKVGWGDCPRHHKFACCQLPTLHTFASFYGQGLCLPAAPFLLTDRRTDKEGIWW